MLLYSYICILFHFVFFFFFFVEIGSKWTRSIERGSITQTNFLNYNSNSGSYSWFRFSGVYIFRKTNDLINEGRKNVVLNALSQHLIQINLRWLFWFSSELPKLITSNCFKIRIFLTKSDLHHIFTVAAFMRAHISKMIISSSHSFHVIFNFSTLAWLSVIFEVLK